MPRGIQGKDLAKGDVEIIYKFLVDLPVFDKLNKRKLSPIETAFGSVSKLKKYVGLSGLQQSTLQKINVLQERIASGKVGDIDKANRQIEKLKTQLKLYDAERKEIIIQNRERRKKQQLMERERKLSKQTSASLGIGLSVLFTSMMVHQRISAVLKDISTTYQQITKGQTEYSNSVNRLSAAFGFLKFSIASALDRTPAGAKLINTLVTLLNKIAEFATANPTLSLSLLIGGKAISTLTDIASIVANFWLLSVALRRVRDVGTITSSLSVVASFGATAAEVLPILLKAAAVPGLIYEVSMLIKAIYGEEEPTTKIGEMISHLIGTFGWASILSGNLVVGSVALLVKLAWDTGFIEKTIKDLQDLGNEFLEITGLDKFRDGLKILYDIVTEKSKKIREISPWLNEEQNFTPAPKSQLLHFDIADTSNTLKQNVEDIKQVNILEGTKQYVENDFKKDVMKAFQDAVDEMTNTPITIPVKIEYVDEDIPSPYRG